MAVPLVAYPIMLGLSWVANKIIAVLFYIGGSFFAKTAVLALIATGFSYFAVTKLEALDLITDFIITEMDNNNGIVGIGEGSTLDLSSLGVFAKLLRFEDVLFVYISAYLTGYLIKILISAISVSRKFVPA